MLNKRLTNDQALEMGRFVLAAADVAGKSADMRAATNAMTPEQQSILREHLIKTAAGIEIRVDPYMPAFVEDFARKFFTNVR